MTTAPDTLPILYWANGSIPSWQVLCLLHERGVRFEGRRLRVMSTPKETRTPEFLAINPRGQAPTWVEPDGRVVAESMALLLYLDRTQPGPSLLPTDPAQLGRALQLCFEVAELRAAYRPLEQLFLGADTLDAARREAARQAPARVAAELAHWERHLGDAPFIAGHALTLADCVVYPVLAYQQRRGLMLDDLPGLAGYTARMAARPAIQAARPHGWGEKPAKDLFALAAKL
jgi:glutathione S-transferase